MKERRKRGCWRRDRLRARERKDGNRTAAVTEEDEGEGSADIRDAMLHLLSLPQAAAAAAAIAIVILLLLPLVPLLPQSTQIVSCGGLDEEMDKVQKRKQRASASLCQFGLLQGHDFAVNAGPSRIYFKFQMLLTHCRKFWIHLQIQPF